MKSLSIAQTIVAVVAKASGEGLCKLFVNFVDGNLLLGEIKREDLEAQMIQQKTVCDDVGRNNNAWRIPLQYVQGPSIIDTAPQSILHLTLVTGKFQHIFVTHHGCAVGWITRARFTEVIRGEKQIIP